jgi:hypothetical protein
MSTTKAYRVYGVPGHRQKEAFNNSYRWDFSEGDNARIIEVLNADITGDYNFSVVIITRNTEKECDQELEGQLTDGVFENSRTAKVIEVAVIGCETEKKGA